MGARVSRVVSTVVLGGMASLALGFAGPVADAAPTRAVSADCNSTVTAAPGDTIISPLAVLGTVRSGTALVGTALCPVTVVVVESVTSPVVKPTPVGVGGIVPSPKKSTVPAGRAPAPASTPTTPPRASPGAAAPAPAVAPAAAAAAFAPAFGALPSSFLASAAPMASPIGSAGGYDPGLLLSGAPGLRVPSFLGLDPAGAVTSTSQLQALPVDGLRGGLGAPSVLAVLGISAVAALGVRRAVMGRRLLPGRSDGTGTATA